MLKKLWDQRHRTRTIFSTLPSSFSIICVQQLCVNTSFRPSYTEFSQLFYCHDSSTQCVSLFNNYSTLQDKVSLTACPYDPQPWHLTLGLDRVWLGTQFVLKSWRLSLLIEPLQVSLSLCPSSPMAGIFPTLDRISISDDIGKFFSDEMVFNTFPQNLLQIPGKCQTFAEPAKSNYGSWIKFCMLLVKRFPFIPKPQSPFYQNQPKPKFVSSLLLRCQLARECHYKLHQDDNDQERFKRLGKYSWSEARRAKTLQSWPRGPSRLLVLGIYVKPVHCRIEWTEWNFKKGFVT